MLTVLTIHNRNMFSLGLFLYFLIINNNLQYTSGLKVMCEDQDYECFKRAIKTRVYPMFVAGVAGVVETSDPLRIDSVTADSADMKYSLQNAAMTGFKDCHFEQMNISKMNTNETNFKYELLCPRLSIQSDYEAKGQINTTPVKGKGPCTLEYGDYYFIISGTHERVREENGDLHVNLLHYELVPELKGTVKYDYKNLVFGDQSKVEEYTRKLEENTRSQVIDIIMKKYMDNLKRFLNYIPTRNLHFKSI